MNTATSANRQRQAEDEKTDLRNLLRAYNLLVATRDDERAIAGTVSRNWLHSEREDFVKLSEVGSGVLRTVRGREILCDVMMPDLDVNVDQVNIESLLLQLPGCDKQVNSNCLPKLEPGIAADLLLGVMLLGVQKYGNRRRGSVKLDHDLIIAAMVRDTLGRVDRYSAVLPGKYRVVDLEALHGLFGDRVVDQLLVLLAHHNEFLDAFAHGGTSSLSLPRPYGTVIAAIHASRLRLVARAAGDNILANLSDDKKRELKARGVPVDGLFPERPALELSYRQTRAALALNGVEYGALSEPLEQTLMIAVADALEDSSKRRRLVGRRGKAVYDVHNSLPLVELFDAAENYNSLETVHLAALEMMQYLEKGRRKSACTMLGHSLRIAAVAEHLLGPAMEPSYATIAILHDVVEDGSRHIAGYDQSLGNIKRRFGGPLAAMVSELTDAESSVAAHKKAEATLNCESLILAQQQYTCDRFTEMTLQPTATHEPYTLGGIITKIIDTAISEEEGIRDPDIMSGWWRHSGVRIYWAYHVRGRVVRPLLMKLAREIECYQRDPQASDLSAALIEGLQRVVRFSVESSDHYAVQNLAILSDEYGLSRGEREQLIGVFFDESVDQQTFTEQVVNNLLCDERLKQSIASGIVPAESYVTLYTKYPGRVPQPDHSTFVMYRNATLQRRKIVRQLSLPESTDGLNAITAGEVVSLYDYRKAA
jgi:hypothetical protein